MVQSHTPPRPPLPPASDPDAGIRPIVLAYHRGAIPEPELVEALVDFRYLDDPNPHLAFTSPWWQHFHAVNAHPGHRSELYRLARRGLLPWPVLEVVGSRLGWSEWDSTRPAPAVRGCPESG
jgi:hypothetical protein